MKLLNRWTRKLSVGMTVAVAASSVIAADNAKRGGSFKPASYASLQSKEAITSSYMQGPMMQGPSGVPQGMQEMPGPQGGYPGMMPGMMPNMMTGMQPGMMQPYQQAGFQPPMFQPHVEPTIGGYSFPNGPSQSMVVPASCDSSICDEASCDSMGEGCGCGCGGIAGQFGPGACSCGTGGCGSSGCGGCGGDGCMTDRFGGGCGPLGCDGGTFGDGRSVGSLCSALSSRFASLMAIGITPYGEGGVASQRWFDLSADVIFLQRTRGANNFNFSSQGRASDNFVLGSNNVDLDKLRAGLALQANIQTGPGSNIEGVYFGLNKWSESATAVSSPANSPTLYSFFSDFGRLPFDGFDDPDRSFRHTLTYTSQLNNGELNFRRRWVEPNGFLQGSFLAGVRYFELGEGATFTARGENNDTAAANGPRFFNYLTKTSNHMTGFQIGGDLWLNLIPGVKVGTELKTGIYGNHSIQSTNINANSLPAFGIAEINERVTANRAANVTQFNLQGIYRLSYHWTLRGSYQLLYVDNVALATENFNGTPPSTFLINSSRVPTIHNKSDVLYQGFTSGVEYLW